MNTNLMAKKIYNSPLIECMPVSATGRVCAESFFDPLNIGEPANAGDGR